MINKIFGKITKEELLNSIKDKYAVLGPCDFCPVPPTAKFRKQLRIALICSWVLNIFCYINSYLGPDFLLSKKIWSFLILTWFFNFLILANLHYKLLVSRFFPKTLLLEIPRSGLTSVERKSFLVGFVFIMFHICIGAAAAFKALYEWNMQNYRPF